MRNEMDTNSIAISYMHMIKTQSKCILIYANIYIERQREVGGHRKKGLPVNKSQNKAN